MTDPDLEIVELRAEVARLRAQLARSETATERGADGAARQALDELREKAEFLERVLESSGDCIKVLSLDGRLEFLSAGGMAVMEVDDFCAIVGRPWLDFWEGEGRDAAGAALDEARAGRTGRFQGHALTAKGTPKDWDVVVTPIRGADGRPERLLSISRDVTDLRLAMDALRESEERRRLAVEAADIGIWDLDVATGALRWDARCKALFGLPSDAAVTYDTFLAGLHPEDRAGTEAAVGRAADPSGTGEYAIEYRTLGLADGVERWVLATGRTRFEAGRAVRFTGTVTDITDRKRAEDRARLLAEEMHHRVTNTLAVVQAIVSQSLRNAGTPAEAGKSIDARLEALGRAHDLLIQTDWAGSDLRAIVDAAMRPHDDGVPDHFRVEGPPVALSAQASTALALILHELATNAAKYGALSTGEGHVAIRWGLTGAAGDEERVRLRWQERGGPPVAPPRRKGFGTRLIEGGLRGASGGAARLAYEPTGVVCEIEAPAATLRGAPDR